MIGDILEFCREVNLFSFSFVPRLANRVAHGVAKLALGFFGESVWLDECRLSVESLVLGDSSTYV